MALVRVITMKMFCQQHCGCIISKFIVFVEMYLCTNYNTCTITRPCCKLVKELTARHNRLLAVHEANPGRYDHESHILRVLPPSDDIITPGM